jgi:hypothetical protein
MLHVTSIVKLLDEIIQFNGANHPQILPGPFGGSIHLFHVHNNGVLINLRENSRSKYEGSPPLDVVEGGASGLNYTPCLVKPLVMVTLFHVLGSCSLLW